MTQVMTDEPDGRAFRRLLEGVGLRGPLDGTALTARPDRSDDDRDDPPPVHRRSSAAHCRIAMHYLD